jgi:DNA-binding Xre family transcriptional regulator
MINLGPDKLMICKLSIKKLRENKGITRNNLNNMNHI